jgi:hypothetical protein
MAGPPWLRLGAGQELVPHGLLLVVLMVLVGLVAYCVVMDVIVVAVLMVDAFLRPMVAVRKFRKVRRVFRLDAVNFGAASSCVAVPVGTAASPCSGGVVDGRRNRRSVGNLGRPEQLGQGEPVRQECGLPGQGMRREQPRVSLLPQSGHHPNRKQSQKPKPRSAVRRPAPTCTSSPDS